MSQRVPITSLPIELFFQIADHLEPSCIYSLYHVNKLLHRVLPDYLYQRLLKEKEIRNEAGRALHQAALNGNLNLVRFLLDYADNASPFNNPLPLPTDLVSFALKAGDETALIAAVRAERECILRIFRWNDFEHDDGTRKATPFTSPEKERRFEIARLLLIRGVDFDAVDDNFKSALHYASQYGDSEMVRLLLMCGAKAEEYDYGHLTPLHLAVYCNRLETVKTLLEFERVQRTIDMITEDDDTALMIAAEGGYIEILRVLLDHGADANLYNMMGESTLSLAAFRGNAESVRLLLAHGANPDTKNMDGKSPLEMAEHSFAENEEVIQLLREALGLPLNCCP
jgi:ankyrin repeat protein